MIFLFESLVACAVFTLFVFLMSRNPIKSIFNYPPAIIERCDNLGLVDASNKPGGVAFYVKKVTAMIVFGILLGLLVRYVNGCTSFWCGALTAYALWLVVNWFDALVLDCIWFCHDKHFVISGTEDMTDAYHDYLFHIKGAFIGMALGIPAALVAGTITCKQVVVDPAGVKDAVSAQMEAFPESRLQDLYKSFFQDRFGPGHIIKDRQSALDYIQSELAEADTLMGPETEPCGWQGNYVRVNLSVISDGKMTAEEMADALMASAKEVKEKDIKRWRMEWERIEAIIEKEYPDLPDLAEDKAGIDALLDAGQYACHHSAAYEAAYHPHYRIISKDLLESFNLETGGAFDGEHVGAPGLVPGY